MYQNAHFLNRFFALLDFGSRDEERRAKDEGRRTKGERISKVKEKSEALISKSETNSKSECSNVLNDIRQTSDEIRICHREHREHREFKLN
jgi:hypothetical protein